MTVICAPFMQRVGSTLQQLNITVCAEVDLLEMEGHVLVGGTECYIHIGGVFIYNACSNGHQFCKNLVSSPTYNQWSFLPEIRFIHLQIGPQC